ncbi:MAG: alpha/beta hydrolase [Acidobacteria bacterium]|nr:alpha/beta hydrolase [Acidobacteriota bacterium]
MRSIPRALLTAAAILMFLVLAGATYQGAATALERREFPHLGRLVDVGGHQLHIYCLGEGSPTVVLEAPATGMSAAWGWVQPAVAELTRVCSYDRAGLGWSEAGDRQFEPSAVPAQLHTLLERAEEPGPYVIAGQGLGAAFATSYAAQFGREVAALVLVDPPAVDALSDRNLMMRFVNASPWLARTGLLRATCLMSSNAAGLPQHAAGALRAFLNRPDHLTRAARELSRWNDAVALGDGAALDPTVRVTRIEAAGGERAALLADEATARKVSTALAGIVESVRAQR